MHQVAELLAAWNSFYVMIGSSASALTGLMFVVITLVADRGPSEEGVSTYSTPTVVHFCCALFTAAVMSAPFKSVVPIAILLGLAGATCFFYAAYIGVRTSRTHAYRPDLEDWTFYVVLPLLAYAAIVFGAATLPAHPARALFAPAAAVTLLIFIGIHNAWDVVTFLAMGKSEALPDADAGDKNATS